MILTVTLNPALDVTYDIPSVRLHSSHRVTRARRRAGGKGVNVSRVLHQLGHATLATGFLGGAVGDAIRADLDAADIPTGFVDLGSGAASRSTMTIVDEQTGDATVFNEPGPSLTAEDWNAFLHRFDTQASSADRIVLSGSLPPGLPEDAYGQLCERTAVPCLVDASGAALEAAARAGADVLLPNVAELREATGCVDPADGAQRLLAAGAGAVVVSNGGDGLMAFTTAGAWQARSTEWLRGNPTGAGDALTAAIAATAGEPWLRRLREALAWSAAAVPVPVAGEVDPATLERVRAAAVINELKEHHAPRTDR